MTPNLREVLSPWAPVFRIVILAIICMIAVGIRVFSVSVI